MNILALDLGTKCGWAVDAHRSGTWDLHCRRGESEGMRFIHFENRLQEILNMVRHGTHDRFIDLVVYEDVRRHLGVDAAHIYGGLLASMMKTCEWKNIPYAGYGVGEIKKFATGKGNAPKEAMIEAAGRLYPLARIEDDNHADALCLLALAHDKHSIESIQK